MGDGYETKPRFDPGRLDIRGRPSVRFDVRKIRKQFSVLQRKVQGKRLIYLDNATLTQKPQAVFEAMARYYAVEKVHARRRVPRSSEAVTRLYDEARETVRDWLNANEAREIRFVRGTAEAIEVVAETYARRNIRTGDEVVITEMEHQANVAPWQRLCKERGAVLRVAPVSDTGEILIDKIRKLLTPKTRLLAVAHVSNVLGTINPVRSIIRMAHEYEIPVLVDGAQAVRHLDVDVLELDCDFYVFCGCKLYGPAGIGVLYAKASRLDEMALRPGESGRANPDESRKATDPELPYPFEADTPPIAGAVGLAAAIDFLRSYRREEVLAYERGLTEYATAALAEITGLRIVGPNAGRIGIFSWVLKDVHAHDAGAILSRAGIAVQTGDHCAPLLMKRLKVPATARASLALYTTREEIDALVVGIERVKKKFA